MFFSQSMFEAIGSVTVWTLDAWYERSVDQSLAAGIRALGFVCEDGGFHSRGISRVRST